MEAKIIRTMFCGACFAKHHPTIEDRFVLLGKSTLIVHDLEWNPSPKLWGFTPHYITDYEPKDLDVILECYCCIDGCGIDIVPNLEKGNFTVYLRRPKFTRIPFREWLALQKFIDPDYSLI